MKSEIKKYLYDILEAAKDIENFVEKMNFSEYEKNSLLIAGVERKFEIIGEALNKIKSIDNKFIERISEHRRIIGFRNILAHGYDVIENKIVWDAIKIHLPLLKSEVENILNV